MGFQAEFGQSFAPDLNWIWDENAMVDILALGKAFRGNKRKTRDSWDKYYLQQLPVAKVTATMSSDKLNRLRGASNPQLTGTFRWVWGFLPNQDRDALLAAYDPKALLGKRRLEASEAEWASFAEKLQKRKGSCRQGADVYYIRGVSPADLSAFARQAVSHSDPVLPGGVQFQKATRDLKLPFTSSSDDPLELPDDAALAAMENWILDAHCPRWLRDRYRRQNKRRGTGGRSCRPAPNGLTDGGEAPTGEPVADAAERPSSGP